MTPTYGKPERFPYWNYVDLLLLLGMALPCLIAATVVAQLLSTLAPVLGQAKVWVQMLLFYLLWFGSLYLVMKVRYFDSPISEALGWVYPRRGLLLCLASGPLLAIAVGILGALLKTPMIDLPIKKLLQGQLSLALFGLFSVILGPVTEELAFRGFFMPLLIRTFGREVGILLAAVPFGLLHGPQYGWLWQPVLLVTLTGVIFGIARQATGSTMASAAMHSTYNLTFYIALCFGAGQL
jgi:membrane protease YdiL (CAAX protease family)